MKKRFSVGVTALACLLAAVVARAEVKVDVEHNTGDQATADFKFKTVPAPAKDNAAIKAKFSVCDGDKDDNGGDLEVLHDGKLPAEQDEPATNFFFNAGTEGGRIAIDLGSVIDVKQVNTYSWHTDTRAPQLYTLYGADGTAAGFNGSPSHDVDPAKAGWTMITKVDTRPKTGDAGGQYGVSVYDSAGSLGKYRYLLLVCERTESDDDFGNTFYSEICVIDAKEMVAPAGGADKPNTKLVQIDNGKYTVTIDTTQTPDLTEWADKELTPMIVEWYPKLVDMLPTKGYTAPEHFSITFVTNKDGVAYTMGNRIVCMADFFRNEINGQAKGAILHEMVHVVQQYGVARKFNPHPNQDPGYLVEGIPDYIRWYDYEPQSHGANISKRGFAKAKYDGSYRITANFLNYVVTTYDKTLVPELNDTLRTGNYTKDFWKQKTGKTLDELNDEWKADLAKTLNIPATN